MAVLVDANVLVVARCAKAPDRQAALDALSYASKSVDIWMVLVSTTARL